MIRFFNYCKKLKGNILFCLQKIVDGNNGTKNKRICIQQCLNTCAACGIRYKTAYHFNNHLRFLPGWQPLECSICYKKFCTYSSYRKHLKIHEDLKSKDNLVQINLNNQQKQSFNIKNSVTSQLSSDLHSISPQHSVDALPFAAGNHSDEFTKPTGTGNLANVDKQSFSGG